jgi:hypothetical protein
MKSISLQKQQQKAVQDQENAKIMAGLQSNVSEVKATLQRHSANILGTAASHISFVR